MKAIETIYNGYRFRSRLEARWAVFFDEMNIKYNYEPEGFKCSNGKCYLPDFYLPQFEMYCEVKGMSDHIQDDIEKALTFVSEKKTALLFLSEIPYEPASRCIYWFPVVYYVGFNDDYSSDKYPKLDERRILIINDSEGGVYTESEKVFNILNMLNIASNPYHSKMPKQKLNKMFYERIQIRPGCNFDRHITVCEYEPSLGRSVQMERTDFDTQMAEDHHDGLLRTEQALLKARQARFEHGETPGG